jgi:hypothetical protein
LEALRLVFDSILGKRFAVRPFFGGINGISGLSVFQDLAREDVTNTTGNSERVSQDYVVLPNQQHLDGVAIKPGTVKQLTVVPTVTHQSSRLSSKLKWPGGKSKSTEGMQDETRTGSTIEWQMTGKDTLGGIQLQIIPEFDVKKIHAGATEHLIVSSNISSSCAPEQGEGAHPQLPEHHKPHTPVSIPGFDILKTPRELGLHEGQYVYIKDIDQLQEGRPKTIRDLLKEAPTMQPSNGSLELEVMRYRGDYIFNIQGIDLLMMLFF